MLSIPQVSRERARVVADEITIGSDTHLRFYVLLMVAAMIACFGLAANSTAVIIGAMLVSPLMTPIFGIALGMLHGNSRLLGRAFVAEASGAALAIVASGIIGTFSLQIAANEATPEMLARTQPHLLDLLVAVLAGFAGAYALVDERISPALPGVAIATAIVPPLSTCGLCLSLGAWAQAGGALLLFLANFISILLVALLTFAACGLARPQHVDSWQSFAKRFGWPIGIFLLLLLILTNSLVRIMNDRQLVDTLEEVLLAELDDDYAVELDDFEHRVRADRVEVLATVRAPGILKSARVLQIQSSLKAALQRPVALVVRTMLAKDVTPTGSSLKVANRDTGKALLAERPRDLEAREALAEQVIREQFEGEPGFEVTKVEFGVSKHAEGLVLAYVNTIRRLSRSEIASVEQHLRTRFDDPSLTLFMRINAANLEYRDGPVRIEWTRWRGAKAAEVAELPKFERTIRDTIEELIDAIPVHVHFNINEESTRILVEVVGPQPLSPLDAELVQQQLSAKFGRPIELNLWYRADFVVNANGYTTYERLSDPELDERSRMLRELFRSEEAPVALGEETAKLSVP